MSKNYDRSGMKVRTRYPVHTYCVSLPPKAEGEVAYEEGNGVGRTLVYVHWENENKLAPVFPEDIEII